MTNFETSPAALSSDFAQIRRHFIDAHGCSSGSELMLTLTDVEEEESFTMTLSEFVEENLELWGDIFSHVMSSAPGEKFLFGGGASPAFEIQVHTL